VTEGLAQVFSPTYQDSASECYFNFYLYLSGDGPVLMPLMVHMELEYITFLDAINTNVSSDGIWTKVEIGIGRHFDNFQLGFALTHIGHAYSEGVAVDEVNFFDCNTPLPQGTCTSNEFHCTYSEACVHKTLLCDYQDDCGDFSDEIFDGGQGCRTYLRSNFEDPHHPFGMFSNSENGSTPDSFHWIRGNGSTGNLGTGPPFDHTLFSPKGHYLYIRSEQAKVGDAAWLWSPILTANQSRDCKMRFFSHMHGQGVGNLTVYVRARNGNLTKIFRLEGSAPDMDINKWRRQTVEGLDSFTGEFHIILEATVGIPGMGDIGIDDVSFTPQCKYLDDVTTTPTHSTATTHSTPITHSTPTTHSTPITPSKPTTHSPSSSPYPTATPSPGDDSHTFTVIIVVLIILVVLLVLAVGGFFAYKNRSSINVHINSFINPGYRENDTNMVSLRELSAKEN